jgi:hypothetical protein
MTLTALRADASDEAEAYQCWIDQADSLVDLIGKTEADEILECLRLGRTWSPCDKGPSVEVRYPSTSFIKCLKADLEAALRRAYKRELQGTASDVETRSILIGNLY